MLSAPCALRTKALSTCIGNGALLALVRCCIHRIPLQDACPNCGESDPLSFESPDLEPNHSCRACGGSLAHPPVSNLSVRYEPAIQAVEEAYRAALLGVSPHPSLVGKATDRAFRRFVDDMLQLLISFPQPTSLPRTKRDNRATLPPRQSPFATIAELIANAAPSSDKRVQDFRYRQSLKTWTCLARSQTLRKIPWTTPAGTGPWHCSVALPRPFSAEPEDDGHMIGFDG